MFGFLKRKQKTQTSSTAKTTQVIEDNTLNPAANASETTSLTATHVESSTETATKSAPAALSDSLEKTRH